MTTVSETKEELDEIDMQILHMLQQNSLTSHEELGATVGLAESTVRYRIKKLQELGIILGYTCAIDLGKLGYDFIAFANLDVEAGKERLVAQKLAKLPNVIGLFAVSGSPDMVSLLVARNKDELTEIVEKARAIKEVHKMTCNLALRTYKWECTTKIPVQKR